jgi:hypothetical protein
MDRIAQASQKRFAKNSRFMGNTFLRVPDLAAKISLSDNATIRPLGFQNARLAQSVILKNAAYLECLKAMSDESHPELRIFSAEMFFKLNRRFSPNRRCIRGHRRDRSR